MELTLSDSEILASRIVDILIEETRFILAQYRKIATRRTYDSLRGEFDATDNKILARMYSLESLFFIVSGRRPGAKLPVRNVGGRFELVQELQDWVRAVGYTGNYYLLARKIAERGIKGVPVLRLALDRAQPRVIQLVRSTVIGGFRQRIINDLRLSLKGI